jgi:hypothetical protein
MSDKEYNQFIDGSALLERYSREDDAQDPSAMAERAVKRLREGRNEVGPRVFRSLAKWFCDTKWDLDAVIESGRLQIGKALVVPRSSNPG